MEIQQSLQRNLRPAETGESENGHWSFGTFGGPQQITEAKTVSAPTDRLIAIGKCELRWVAKVSPRNLGHTEGTATAKTAYLCPLSRCGSHSDHCGGGDGGAGYGDVVGEDVSRGNRRRGLRHFEKIPPRNEAGGAHVKVIYMSQKVRKLVKSDV